MRSIQLFLVFALAAVFAISIVAQPKGSTARFSSGVSTAIPVEIDNNIILLKVSVNGRPPVRFIFDTGASVTVINADRAEAFGVKGTEEISGSATGGKIEGLMAQGVKLAVEGSEVPSQPVGILAMPRVPGFDFDGVIGFDFINAFVVEIDYLAKVMKLHDPALYRYGGRGAAIPLMLKGRQTPLMTASFLFGGKHVPARLELDTGGDNAFRLDYPIVEKHRLVTKDLAKNMGRGAGGEVERVVSRAKRVLFGPFAFNDVPVLFSLQKEGLEDGGNGSDGILGGEVLRRFRVIIDYSRSRMILEPNKHLKQPFDMIEG